MAMKLPTRPTQAPMRGLPLTTGSLPAVAAFLIAGRPLGESASPARSGTTLERSRMRPSASRIAGFSRPAGPKRNSLMTISSMVFGLVGPNGRADHASGMDGGQAGSEASRERAAVDQQVLAGDVAGVGGAEERAGGAEFVGRAEAPGRDGRGARCGRLLDRDA